ncbi:hypothetical protein AtEden1_Chr2g0230421 [Arabidopsis thaliana]
MEKEGTVFRFFKTRKDTILPSFDKWRPSIRERYVLHAHHTTRVNDSTLPLPFYHSRMY